MINQAEQYINTNAKKYSIFPKFNPTDFLLLLKALGLITWKMAQNHFQPLAA